MNDVKHLELESQISSRKLLGTQAELKEEAKLDSHL